MSYAFSGTGNSHGLETDISATPFPSAAPFAIAGWSTLDSLTANGGTQFCLYIDGDAQFIRISLSNDHNNGEFDYVTVGGAVTDNLNITIPTRVKANDWVFRVFNLFATNNRIGYIVHNGIMSQATTTVSVAFDNYDRVTLGYLPFFGDESPHAGKIGSWAVWNRTLSEPEIMLMGRGEPLEHFRNGFVDGWHLDGRQQSGTIPSINGTIDLTTIDGPPAYSLESEPRLVVQDRPELWAPFLGAPTNINTREKRASVLGVGRPWMRNKEPSTDKDQEWRMATANTYGGNPLAAGGSTVPVLDEGMLTGGLQVLGGGLD